MTAEPRCPGGCHGGDFPDFDHYVDTAGIQPSDYGAAFAAWMNAVSGWDGPMEELVSGRRVGLVAYLSRRPRLITPASSRLFDAVEAVVARHVPEPIEGAPGRVFCAGCGADVTDGDCPDVAAFADALLPAESPVDGPKF